MASAGDEIKQAVAALAADPAFAAFAAPDAALLVWDPRGERLLWSSPAAETFVQNLVDAAGRLHASVPARDRLARLGAGLAPTEGMRIERLGLDRGRLTRPAVCACRRVHLASGAIVLVTAVVGPFPSGPSRPVAPPAPSAGMGARPDAAAAPQPRGTVRFVWQADADTRFTQVSESLRGVVGPVAADIVGRTWQEVSASLASDPDGAVASLFARGETWSGHVVFWRIDGTALEVPVELGGMPVFGADRQLLGFRGFGLCRGDAIRVREAAAADATDPEPAEARVGDETPVEDKQMAAEEALATAEKAASVAGHTAAEEPRLLARVSAVAELRPGQQEAIALDGGRDNWFVGIRERVAARLGGPRLIGLRPGEMSPSSDDARPPAAPSLRPSAPALRLSGDERSAFREIARALGARFEDEPASLEDPGGAPATTRRPGVPTGPQVLDLLPAPALVHRGDRLLFANRSFLDLTGYRTAAEAAEGGLARLFGEGTGRLLADGDSDAVLRTRGGESLAVGTSSVSLIWDGMLSSLSLVREKPSAVAEPPRDDKRARELEAVLDAATDGVVVLDEAGCIRSLNRSAEALFGYQQDEVAGAGLTVLLAARSHPAALALLDGVRRNGSSGPLKEGREVLGRVRQGGTIPVLMTVGPLAEESAGKLCVVFRDMSAFKRAEDELLAAKRAAEEASAQKSDLLARISHEIRTPLNAIIGFAEVMLEERFGPVGNDRYRDYLKDVRASGTHVISLVNDLLDLAKIEAGRMDLAFTSINLNELVATCVTLLQQEAVRHRIVMRTSFAAKLPPVRADARSVRQIVLNLVSNAIKFTDAGGQVIVSTALTDQGEAVLRVRDTGIGMTAQETEAALEPFRQLATARKGGGTGLGLPLTKALVEANGGTLLITSAPDDGTLAEVLLPRSRTPAR